MTTGHAVEDLIIHLHGLYCECPVCREQRGLKPADPNDELGFTTADDTEAW